MYIISEANMAANLDMQKSNHRGKFIVEYFPFTDEKQEIYLLFQF